MAGCAWYGERIEHFPAGLVLRESKSEMGEVVQAEWIFADNSRLFLKNGIYALQWPESDKVAQDSPPRFPTWDDAPRIVSVYLGLTLFWCDSRLIQCDLGDAHLVNDNLSYYPIIVKLQGGKWHAGWTKGRGKEAAITQKVFGNLWEAWLDARRQCMYCVLQQPVSTS